MNNLSNEELVQVHATAREARMPVVWTEKKALAHFKIKITPEVVEAMAHELLALREAGKEPVAYIFKHPAGKLFWSLSDESNKGQSDVIPVYAPPQLPAVPEGAEERLAAAVELLKQAAPHMLADESLKDPGGALCGKMPDLLDIRNELCDNKDHSTGKLCMRPSGHYGSCTLSRSAIAAAPKPEPAVKK